MHVCVRWWRFTVRYYDLGYFVTIVTLSSRIMEKFQQELEQEEQDQTYEAEDVSESR